MKIINASFTIEHCPSKEETLHHLERAIRTAYKSEDKGGTEESASKVIRTCMAGNHESVLEHLSITVRFIVDRGVSHELVRHRLASFTQESTRYCDYSKEKFGNELTFIHPCFWDEGTAGFSVWRDAMSYAERTYLDMIANGAKPQQARSVLPNSLKTEVVMTANLREWRHVLKLRGAASQHAHPQMREVMIPLLLNFQAEVPIVFDDIDRPSALVTAP